MKEIKKQCAIYSITDSLDSQIKAQNDVLRRGIQAANLSSDQQREQKRLIAILENERSNVQDIADSAAGFDVLRRSFNERLNDLKTFSSEAGEHLGNIFRFCDEVFGDGQEMLILVTELTMNYYCSRFINVYGCQEYFNHNREILLYERSKEIAQEINLLSDDLGI